MKFIGLIFCLLVAKQSSAQNEINSNRTVNSTKATNINKDSITEPAYPGGQLAWQKYLTDNMQYPPKALGRQIQGAVIIQFLVDTSGKVSDISITDGPRLLREESIRLLNNSGQWLPGTKNGELIGAYKKMVIFFSIEVKKKDINMNQVKVVNPF